MWEFTTTNQNITQQLSSLVAVVAVAIIGVAILLIPNLYKNFKNTFSFLTSIEKLYIFKITYFFFTTIVLILLITDFVGIYIPTLVQTIGWSLFVILTIILLVYLIISGLFRRHNRKSKPKLEILPYLYLNALVWTSSCIFACTIALFGVVYPMLDIEIGPFNQDNFNWARWLLLDGIIFFFMAILSFALIYISQIKILFLQNKEQKKISKAWYILLIIIICVFIIIVLTSTIGANEKYKNTGSSFLRDFFFIPLDMKARVNINNQYFIITNESDFDWQNVTILINEEELSSGYTNDVNLIKKAETVTIDIKEFAKYDGTRFDISIIKPLRVTISVENSMGRSGKLYGTLEKVHDYIE